MTANSKHSTNHLISLSSKEEVEFNQKIRIGVMASGKGSNFEALVKYTLQDNINAEVICLIVNNKDSNSIKIAEKYNIDYTLHDHRLYKDRESLDKAIVSTLQSHNVDTVVMAGWMRIVSDVLIDSYHNRLINIHPSLLPSFKGKDAIRQAIESGVTITGCTVHVVTKEVDSGEILAQAAVPVLVDDDEFSLKQRIQEQEHNLLTLAIEVLASKYPSN